MTLLNILPEQSPLFSSTFSFLVPLNNLNVVVNPNNSRVYEGQELLLLCGVKGTPPITFKWHHNGNKLKTNTSNVSFMSYHIESLTKDDSGTYQCEASNQANRVLRSEMITIEGENHEYSCLMRFHML